VTSQALKLNVINFCQHVQASLFPNLISPQRPLSAQHPSYHTLH